MSKPKKIFIVKRLFQRLTWALGYVKKADLEAYTTAIKHKQQKADEVIRIQNLASLEEKLIFESTLREADLKSDIDLLTRKLNQYEEDLKKARETYYYCLEMIQKNSQVSLNLTLQGRKVRDLGLNISREFEQIQDSAQTLKREMLDHDKKNRKNLQIQD